MKNRKEEADRKELRERHRREREKMNLPRHQEPEPENLFSAPIRVSCAISTNQITKDK